VLKRLLDGGVAGVTGSVGEGGDVVSGVDGWGLEPEAFATTAFTILSSVPRKIASASLPFSESSSSGPGRLRNSTRYCTSSLYFAPNGSRNCGESPAIVRNNRSWHPSFAASCCSLPGS